VLDAAYPSWKTNATVKRKKFQGYYALVTAVRSVVVLGVPGRGYAGFWI
jgi:hypothetical protein